MTKTVFCDIDGTLLYHHGDIQKNIQDPPIMLSGALEKIKQWEKNNYKIILITGRKESTRKQTEQQLFECGIVYDSLLMGLPNGERILINDKKPNQTNNTALAFNVVRNDGIDHIETTTSDANTYTEKPWGWEELVEYNDKYVVKKLFMKAGNSCSLQYHKLKKETIVILSGKLNILADNTEKIYEMGETITIQPNIIHRMTAIEDTLYIECSTNELWDVVRIQDDYGRV
jgi:quercetin dioxygenase-like cupin family protein